MLETLVLDVGYQPIDRVSWQRAFTLWCLEKVEIIEEYEDETVRSATTEWKVPAVIRFLNYVSKRKKAVKFSRENVYTRDKGKCQYCSIKVPRQKITYDHVVPRAQKGKTTWTNVVISCFSCNQKKSNRTPQQARMKLITKPIKPKSLPQTIRLTFVWKKGMPTSWKSYMYDIAYWHTQLDED